MSFDFHYTCPSINKNIERIKEAIEHDLDDIICEFSPMIPDEERERLAKEYAESMYNSIEGSVEDIRNSNEEIRNEANKQISELEDERDGYKEESLQLAADLDSLS